MSRNSLIYFKYLKWIYCLPLNSHLPTFDIYLHRTLKFSLQATVGIALFFKLKLMEIHELSFRSHLALGSTDALYTKLNKLKLQSKIKFMFFSFLNIDFTRSKSMIIVNVKTNHFTLHSLIFNLPRVKLTNSTFSISFIYAFPPFAHKTLFACLNFVTTIIHPYC